MSIKLLGKPAIGEILHAGQELDNAVDKFALKVVQNNETVETVIYRASTREFCCYSDVAEKLLQTPVSRNGDSLLVSSSQQPPLTKKSLNNSNTL